jgi:enoyl-CoA hydratase/carnithine racemase
MNSMFIHLNEKYMRQHIMLLELQRSDRLNAVNDRLLCELQEALKLAAGTAEAEVLIIRSSVFKAFCAGIDVTYVQNLTNEQAAQFFAGLAECLETLIHFPKPTISAVNGYAFGFGADLAIACDLRVGSKSSSFRFPGPQFGAILGTKRLIHELGPAKSRYLTLTNTVVRGKEALRLGLLHELADESQVLESALNRAAKLVQMPRHAVRTIKDLTNANGGGSEALPVELTRNSILTGDFQTRFADFLIP